MDGTRKFDLQHTQATIDDKSQSIRDRQRAEKAKSKILRQYRHPEITELRAKLVKAVKQGDQDGVEKIEGQLRRYRV